MSESTNDFGCFPMSTPDSCSLTLSVDNPASDIATTAAGGTTLPFIGEFCLNAACTTPYYTVTVPHERVWGWDYLIGLCTALGYDPISCGIFPAGSGGGLAFSSRDPPTSRPFRARIGIERECTRRLAGRSGQAFTGFPASHHARMGKAVVLRSTATPCRRTNLAIKSSTSGKARDT